MTQRIDSPSRRTFTTGGLAALAALGLPGVSFAQAESTRTGDSKVYMFAHIKLRPGTVQKFTEMIGPLAAVLRKHGGWKLQGSYISAIGRVNTVVDVWELPDANSVQATLAVASQDPEFQKLGPVLQECIEDETLQLMNKLPV